MKNFLSMAAATLLLAAGVANAQSVHGVTYTARTAALGTQVSLGGKTFVLVRLPMKDFGSANRYIVEFLAEVTDVATTTFAGDLFTEHSDQTLTSTTLIGGFPASALVSDSRTYTFSTQFFPATGNALKVDVQVNCVVQVKVGDTLAGLFADFSSVQQDTTPALVTAPFSGSANAAWGNYVDPITLVTACDNWIDYIRIVQVN
jgi:hypothetical protein